MYMYGMNSGYILVIIMMIGTFIASRRVKSTFAKYSKVQTRRAITGAEAARMILDRNGLNDIRVENVSGSMTDHYDPKSRVVRLSETVYNKRSIAAVSVASHEVGHAIQHSKGYAPLNIRTAFVPLAQIGSKAAWPLIIIGMIIGASPFINIGIIFFSFSVFFQIVTLPVEFNASSRAKRLMSENGFLDDEELDGADAVLSAAAMTYVAAAGVAVAQLLRLLLIRGRD